MCGRYVTPDEAALERDFGLPAQQALVRLVQSFNVVPSQITAVIIESDGEREVLNLVLHFQPAWAKNKWINALAETELEKRGFRADARHHRCVVPVMGWYEWDSGVSPSQPYHDTRVDDRGIGLAGIYTATEKPATATRRPFASLTTDSSPWADPIHDRMPLVLHPRDYCTWLSPQTPASDAEAILGGPFDDGLFES